MNINKSAPTIEVIPVWVGVGGSLLRWKCIVTFANGERRVDLARDRATAYARGAALAGLQA